LLQLDFYKRILEKIIHNLAFGIINKKDKIYLNIKSEKKVK